MFEEEKKKTKIEGQDSDSIVCYQCCGGSCVSSDYWFRFMVSNNHLRNCFVVPIHLYICQYTKGGWWCGLMIQLLTLKDIQQSRKEDWTSCQDVVVVMNLYKMILHITSMMNGYVDTVWICISQGLCRKNKRGNWLCTQ